jgi:serralysin
MAVHYITDDQVGSGVRVTLEDADKLFVAEGVTVGRTDASNWSDFTVTGEGSGQIVDIHGSVVGDGIAINLGDVNTISNNVLNIHETGLVRSYRADAGGVRMIGSDLTLENAGRIISAGSAVVMDAAAIGIVSTIVNEGTIRSTDGAGVYVYTTALGVMELYNTGRITGAKNAYENSAGTPVVDRVYNEGVMKGSVVLGAGDDLYDGRKGVVQDGVIDGGIGTDTLRGGKGAETLVGGDDADKLYGGAGRDVFRFNWSEESAGKQRDLVADFSHKQKDRIDLSLLDDNADAKMDFIGEAKFSKSEGEVRFEQMKGGVTQVQVDLDGNGKADFAVDIKGHLDLVASDFLL